MDRADLIIIALILILMAMVLVLLLLLLMKLPEETSGAASVKGSKKRHLHENAARRADRDVMRQRVEHANFMNYDGTAQMPIDVDALLAESDKHR